MEAKTSRNSAWGHRDHSTLKHTNSQPQAILINTRKLNNIHLKTEEELSIEKPIKRLRDDYILVCHFVMYDSFLIPFLEKNKLKSSPADQGRCKMTLSVDW